MFKRSRRLAVAATAAVLGALLIAAFASAYSTNFDDIAEDYYPRVEVSGITFNSPGGEIEVFDVMRFITPFTVLTDNVLWPEGDSLEMAFDTPQDFVSFSYGYNENPFTAVGLLDGEIVYTVMLDGSPILLTTPLAEEPPGEYDTDYEGQTTLNGRVDTVILINPSGFMIDNVVTGVTPAEEVYSEYCQVSDGSMNAAHCARPVAIYTGEDGYTIYGIDINTGGGILALAVTDEMIAAAGVPANEPVVIAAGQNPYNYQPFTLYRLPSGEFQLNTVYWDGKPYVVKWAEGDLAVTTVDW